MYTIPITSKSNEENEPVGRIGHGYDVHRLVEGRRLILGGVEVPFDKGLLNADSLSKYFPPDFTPKQKVELIEQLVKDWHEQQAIVPVRKGRGR